MLSLLNPQDLHILVIGDMMLDVYNYGDAHRISPEAPVPVFHSKEKKYYLGGAANTYLNLVNAGVNAHLFGLHGSDSNGGILKEMIYSINLKNPYNCLLENYSKPTIVKERIVARSQQIVRVDTEEIVELTKYQVDAFINVFEFLTQRSSLDAIIISDYGKGVICSDLMEALNHDPIFTCTPIFVDPFPKHFEMYKGASYITPNHKEFDEIGGLSILHNILNIKNVIRTEGENGITIFEKGGDTELHINTEAQTVYDVSGAGDTVIAMLATARSMGFTLIDSVFVANKAAGNVVSQMGTTAVDPKFIKDTFKEVGDGYSFIESRSRK